MAPRGMNVFCCQCGKNFELEPDKCDSCGCPGFQHKSPTEATDWQSIAAGRGIDVGLMKEALEQIAIVCTDNMDRDKDHRMALDFVRQIANDALGPDQQPDEPSEVFVRRMRDREWKGR